MDTRSRSGLYQLSETIERRSRMVILCPKKDCRSTDTKLLLENGNLRCKVCGTEFSYNSGERIEPVVCETCLRPTAKPCCPDMACCVDRKKINLCNTCAFIPATCGSRPVLSSDVGGYGDRVIECNNYIKRRINVRG
jgi:hypothetical protein